MPPRGDGAAGTPRTCSPGESGRGAPWRRARGPAAGDAQVPQHGRHRFPPFRDPGRWKPRNALCRRAGGSPRSAVGLKAVRRRVPRQLARLSVAARASPQPARARPRAGPACVGAGGTGQESLLPRGAASPPGTAGGAHPTCTPQSCARGGSRPAAPPPARGSAPPCAAGLAVLSRKDAAGSRRFPYLSPLESLLGHFSSTFRNVIVSPSY